MALPLFPDLPYQNIGPGHRTQWGTTLPPGGKVFYLCSGGLRDGDDTLLSGRIVTTLAAALSQCRAGRGDVIYVLPGHSENVSATNPTWVAGVTILGLGDPNQDDAPTFTWNAVASQWALSTKNVRIANLRLVLGGADDVTKAIVVTAAGCSIQGCVISVGTTSALNAAIAIEIGAGAHFFRLNGNYIYGEIAGAVTDGILVAGVANDVQIQNNRMFFATGAVTTGNIRIAAAALRLLIRGNQITNSLASSETCIGAGAVAVTGEVSNNYVASEAGTPVSDLIEFNAASLLRLFENYGSDTKNTSGLLTPAVVT